MQQDYQVLIGSNFTEDITDYIDGLKVIIKHSGDNYLLNVIDPDTADLTLLNYDGYWNGRNLEKIPIKILCGYDNIITEVFRGYFRLGDKQVKAQTIDVTAQSYFYVFKNPIINKTILENKRVDEILLLACQECNVTNYQLNTSNVVIPVLDLNDYTTWVDVIKLLCEATISIFHYENGNFVFRPLYSDSEVSQYAFTVDNLEDLKQSKSVDTIKNSIIITSNYKSVAQKDKLSENLTNQVEVKNESYVIQSGTEDRILCKNFPLYKDQELQDGVYKYKTDNTVFIISPDSPNYGTMVGISDIDVDNGYIILDRTLPIGTELSVSYKYLQLQLNPGQERTYTIDLTDNGQNMQLLVSAWKNNNGYDNGNKIPFSTITADNTICLTDTIVNQDNKVRFKLKNTTTSVAFISTLQVTGNPIKSLNPISAKFRNSTSISTWGSENELSISNDFIVSEDQAKLLGNFLYNNLSDPIESISLPVIFLLPTLRLGKCTAIEATTGINYDFLITSITHDLSTFTTQIEAIKYPTLTDTLEIDWLQKDSNGDLIGSSLFNTNTLNNPTNLSVQYNNNIDTTKNLAISWADIINANSPIDGYELFISIQNNTGTYTVDFQNDIILQIKPETRGFVLRNLPYKQTVDTTDYFKYYAFAIRPLRNVHPTLTTDGTGILKGDIQYFNTTLKKLDEFTLYNGTSIEQAISGVVDTSSITFVNTIINSVNKNTQLTNDASLKFEDYTGMTLEYDSGNGIVDRLKVGQISPSNYGMLSKDGNNKEVFRVDNSGVKLTDSIINTTTSDGKNAILIDPTNGIKIQKNESGVMKDEFYADIDGGIHFDGAYGGTINANQLLIDKLSNLTSELGNVHSNSILCENIALGSGALYGYTNTFSNGSLSSGQTIITTSMGTKGFLNPKYAGLTNKTAYIYNGSNFIAFTYTDLNDTQFLGCSGVITTSGNSLISPTNTPFPYMTVDRKGMTLYEGSGNLATEFASFNTGENGTVLYIFDTRTGNAGYAEIDITSATQSNVLSILGTNTTTNMPVMAVGGACPAPALQLTNTYNNNPSDIVNLVGYPDSNHSVLISGTTNGRAALFYNNSNLHTVNMQNNGNGHVLDLESYATGYAALRLANHNSNWYLVTDLGGGINNLGKWQDPSSVTLKENFEDVLVLDKVKNIAIKKYTYKSDRKKSKEEIKQIVASVKNKEKELSKKDNEDTVIGLSQEEIKEIDVKTEELYQVELTREVTPCISPMAEDFKEIFGLGDGKGISPADMAGIALQAIKELASQVDELKQEIAELKQKK